jgi:chaperonin GroEL
MNNKRIIFGSDARKKLFKGFELVYLAVSSTLGPCGRNALIETGTGPYITKDGATVAKHINIADRQMEQGVNLLKAVSQNTAIEVGDGTTTATILAYEIMKNSLHLADKKHNIPDIVKGMQIAEKHIVSSVEGSALKIKPSQIKSIAKMSVNGDEHMASTIAQAFETADSEMSVIIEDNHLPKDDLDIVNGWQWGRGYFDNSFANNSDKMKSILLNPLIFITNEELSSPTMAASIITASMGISLTETENGKPKRISDPRPLLVIAKGVSGGALATFIGNHQQGTNQICCVEAPGYTATMNDFLQDISAFTGAKVNQGIDLNDVHKFKYKDFGECEKVITESNKCSIIGGSSKGLEEQLNKVREIHKMAGADWQRAVSEERISKLKGRIVVLKVGSNSEVENQERKDRYEDAIYAVRASLKSGYLPGGGVFTNSLSKGFIKNMKSTLPKYCSRDTKLGYKIVVEALSKPLEKLLSNYGNKRLINKIPDHSKTKDLVGFDFQNSHPFLVNLVDNGIIEPSEVVASAVRQAVSIATTVIRTDTVMTHDDGK